MKLYESLAKDISELVLTGVLKYGDRLPSVRQTSISRRLSMSTVFQAYYLLEAQGLIRARERLGYYVNAGPKVLVPELELPAHAAEDSTEVDVSELVFEILESIVDRKVAPFGSAFPSPSLYPMAALARSMSAALPKLDPWTIIEDLNAGSWDLRREIALRYMINGFQVNPADIVITNGASEALNLCLFAVTKPGDAVVIESPCFYGALQALERQGLKAIEVRTHPREGIDLEALAMALERHQPKACWLMTNFQNPLGCSMPDEKKQALVELLGRHGVPLIEDDVYGDIYFGKQRPPPAKAFDHRGLVMHCSSFSKSLAPGYRIGWVIPGRYLQEVTRLKLSSSISTSAPGQVALTDYLRRGKYDNHLRLLRHTLMTNQNLMMQAIAQYFPVGTKATRPEGGYFVWLELPDSIDTLDIHSQALALDISMAPGPMFSAKRGFTNCLRLNYGHTWDDNAEAALAKLGQLISAHL